jgi:alpha-L-arabinofuranosidase
MNDCNHFGEEGKVVPQTFSGTTLKEGVLNIKIPSKSVIMLKLNTL